MNELIMNTLLISNKLSSPNESDSARFSIVITMIVAIFLAVTTSHVYALDIGFGAKPSCSCLFTDECKKGQICGGSCTDKSDPLDPKNGVCKKKVSIGGLGKASDALNSVIEAYEVAGTNGGGPVDPSVLDDLTDLGLSERQQKSIHNLALALMSMYIGLDGAKPTFRRGHITYRPSESPTCSCPTSQRCAASMSCSGVCLGSTESFQPYLIDAAPKIRAAIVAEYREPGKGQLERTLIQLYSEFPQFLTFGRCEYPLPVVGFKPRHKDAMACLNAEMAAILKIAHDVETDGKAK